MDPKVNGLVYLAALRPDVGESVAKLETMPCFLAPNTDVKKTADGFFVGVRPRLLCRAGGTTILQR